MKILVAGLDWHGRLTDYCASGFRALGHEARAFHVNRVGGVWEAVRGRLPYVPGLKAAVTRRWQAVANHAFLEAVRGFRPDLIYAVVTNGWCLTPETLEEAARFCRRLISDLADDPFRFPEVMAGLSFYTHHFTGYRAALRRLPMVTRVPASYLQGGAEPALFHPVPPDDCAAWRCDIGFVGAAYQTDGGGDLRAAALSALARLDLRVYGDAGWRQLVRRYPALEGRVTARILAPEEANRFYNGAAISLNVIHPQLLEGFTTKTYEIALAGGCQIVNRQEGGEAIFEPGKEILMYRSLDELVALSDRYLADAPARRAIGAQARARALAEYTFAHRQAHVLHLLGCA